MKLASEKFFRVFFAFIFFVSCFSVRFCRNAEALTFSDLTSSHWAYEAIMDMVDRGIMNGYPDGTFRPNSPVQRSETAVILGKIFNLQPIESKKSSLVDVLKTHWAFSYIEAIEKTKLMSETIINNQFMPDKNLTRISFVPIQVRALGMKFFSEKISEQEKSESLQKFTDQSQIPFWARGFLTIAMRAGSMSGYPDKTFKPRKDVTRAEIASLFYEMLRPTREGEEDGYKVVSLISVSGAPFRATLSKKIAGSLFDFSGTTFPNGSVQAVLNDILFLPINADQRGSYLVKVPIGFVGIGEITFKVNYFMSGETKVNKSLTAYSAIPFDLFPNQYRLYALTYNPLRKELIFNSKSAAPISLEIINRTTGDRQNKKIEANKNYSISTVLRNGLNSINLVIQQPDSSWRLSYGINFTVD